jgi:D-alanine-D-alanine ligase
MEGNTELLNFVKNEYLMKRVGIFCGGFSSEFEISVKSAKTIQEHFPDGYEACLIEVTKGAWSVVTSDSRIPFNLSTMSFEDRDGNKKLDAGIVYVHGDPGENGKLQAFLEIQGIPYVNSGPLASALSFDKWYCNQFLRGFDIPVAKSVRLLPSSHFSVEDIIKELGLPLFVKPTDSGSSYGISKVKKSEELEPAIDAAFKEGNQIVLEAFLDGTEVTCGVYRTKEGIHTLPLTEIASKNEFFDYEAKYQGLSDEITPARISEVHTKKVQELAVKVYELLQLRSIARVDFMLVGDTPYVIEVNTTPGFSPASIVPQMLAAAGIPIRNFWTSIFNCELK